MSKKTLFAALMVTGLVLIVLTTPYVSAQGPLANGAAYIDGQGRSIGPGASLWFAFDAPTDKSSVTVTLVNGVALALAFEVYAPDKLNDPPIGRGTQSNVICNQSTGEKCASPDLTWTGGTTGGRYYVKVINNTSNVVGFVLTLTRNGATPTPYPWPYYYGYGYGNYGIPYTPYVQPYVAPYTAPYVAPYTAPYVAPRYNYTYPNFCPPGMTLRWMPNAFGLPYPVPYCG